jgi:hypothetical protein
MPIPSFDAQIAEQVAPEIVERMQPVPVQEPEPFTPSELSPGASTTGTGEQLPPPTDQLQQTYESMVGGTAIQTKDEMPEDSILDTPSFIEAAKATYQRESIIGSVATFGFSQDQDGQWTSDGWNPYQHFAQNDQYSDLLPELRAGAFDNALNPEMFANIAEKTRKEKDLLQTMEDGPIAGVLTGGALSMLDIVSLVPGVGGASKLKLAGRIGLRAVEGASLMGTQEVALRSMQQQRTVTESFLNVGFGAAIGGAFGAFHPKAALNPKNTKSPIVDEKLIAEEGVLVSPMGKTMEEGEVVPPQAVGAARDAHDTQLAAPSWLEKLSAWNPAKLSKLTGVKGSTPVGRAVLAVSPKAREVMQKILDLGGTLTKGMQLGKAHQPSVEDLAMDYMEGLKDEIYTFNRSYADMSRDLSRGVKDRVLPPVSKTFVQEIVRRKLVDDLHQFAGQWRPDNQQWFEAELKSAGMDPEVAGDIVHKYTDDIVKQMHVNNEAVEKRMIELGMIDADKGLGKTYGLPQLWRSEWIVDNREEARRFFMEVFAKRPDATWLRENYDMSLEDFAKLPDAPRTEKAADGTTKTLMGRAQILEEWAGDAHTTGLALAEANLTAAERKLDEALFAMQETAHAVGLTSKEERKLTIAAVRAKAKAQEAQLALGKLGAYAERVEWATARSEKLKADLDFQVARAAEIKVGKALDEAVGGTKPAYDFERLQKEYLEAEQERVAAASRLDNESAALRQEMKRLSLTEEDLKKVMQEAKVARGKAQEAGYAANIERRTKTLERQLQRNLDAQEAARVADEARLRAVDERQRMEAGARVAKKDFGEARKALRFAKKRLRKAKRPPVVDTVDDLLEAMANKERFPTGILEHEIVEQTGRTKERRIVLNSKERARAEQMGMMHQDLFALRDRMYKDLGGRMALMETFGSVGLTAEKRAIRQEYSEMIEAAQAAIRDLPKGSKEVKALEARIAELRQESRVMEEDIDGTVKRILGQQLAATDPESFVTWGMGKLLQANFIRHGMGFILSAMPDVGAVLLQTGPTRKLFPALKEAMNAVRGTGLAKDSVELRRMVESFEIVFHHSRQARTNAVDMPEYRYGIGAAGTTKNRVTGAVDRGMTYATEKVGQWNILQYWNRTWKAAASLVQMAQLSEMLPRYAKLSELDKAKLASLGIEEGSAGRLAALFEKHGKKHGELFDPGADKWADEVDGEEMHRVLRVAIRRLQDRAIPTPGVGDTPLFMSKPAGRLMMQFASLGFKYINTFLRPGMQRLMIYRDHDVLTAYATALSIGSMATAVRGYMNGKEPSDYSPQQWVTESLDRAGFFAYTSPYQDAFTKLFGPSINSALGVDLFTPTARYSRNRWWESLMGPWLGTLGTAGQAASDLAGGDLQKAKEKAILLAPFNQVYRLGSAINDSLTE